MNQKIKIVLISVSDYHIKTGKYYTQRFYSKKFDGISNKKTFHSIYELERYLTKYVKSKSFIVNRGKQIHIMITDRFSGFHKNKKTLSRIIYSID